MSESIHGQVGWVGGTYQGLFGQVGGAKISEFEAEGWVGGREGEGVDVRPQPILDVDLLLHLLLFFRQLVGAQGFLLLLSSSSSSSSFDDSVGGGGGWVGGWEVGQEEVEELEVIVPHEVGVPGSVKGEAHLEEEVSMVGGWVVGGL